MTEEETQEAGLIDGSLKGVREVRSHRSRNNENVQLCFDHEREPKYGEYGTSLAK